MAEMEELKSAQSQPGCAASPATSAAAPAAPLSALLARVEAAEGPDRELDAEIDAAVGGGTPAHMLEGRQYTTHRQYRGSVFDILRPDFIFVGDEHRAAELTASLDAALALVERVLPGWNFSCGSDGNAPGSCWARVFPGNRQTDGSGNQEARTPALALLAALLKALGASA